MWSGGIKDRASIFTDERTEVCMQENKKNGWCYALQITIPWKYASVYIYVHQYFQLEFLL